MHTENSDRSYDPRGGSALPVVGALRIVTLDQSPVPQRRHLPRRQTVTAVAVERRRGDRRNAKPGVDGLLRTVLADDWR